MLFNLVQSGISSYPHRTVVLQFFETVVRYSDFFKIRRECIMPVLESMADSRCVRSHLLHYIFPLKAARFRGLHNPDPSFRSRVYYLFYRFIKDVKSDIPPDICVNIVGSFRDLLPIEVQIPVAEDSETDLLAEAMKSSAFDSQLYLYETVGILCSLVFKNPEQMATLLLSFVKPLMEELSNNLQASTKGGQVDLVPIVKVHHVIMALGNIAKGFPDYPNPLPDGYILPPMDVFAQVAQAILVCLEAMNVFKDVRDAVRI